MVPLPNARREFCLLSPPAFRRPLCPGEIKPYVELTLDAAKDGPFDRAIQTGLTAILVSPHFLFRVEQLGVRGEGAEPVPIGAYELASRLSYFLWSSMPDQELFGVAADGSLLKRDMLEGQVRRMLRDARSQALVANFAVQWLNLTQLDAANPNRRIFKDFDRDLRADMRRETELFFESIVRDDRSILDLLNGRYTFLNERLAKLYGLSGVDGEEFRQVSLTGTPRAGVLTQASILTLTSQPTRTSPVKDAENGFWKRFWEVPRHLRPPTCLNWPPRKRPIPKLRSGNNWPSTAKAPNARFVTK